MNRFPMQSGLGHGWERDFMQITTEHTGLKQGLTVGERGSLTRAQFTLPARCCWGLPQLPRKQPHPLLVPGWGWARALSRRVEGSPETSAKAPHPACLSHGLRGCQVHAAFRDLPVQTPPRVASLPDSLVW